MLPSRSGMLSEARSKLIEIFSIVFFLNLYYTFITYDEPKSNKQPVKSNKQRAKNNEQWPKSNEQRGESNEQRAKSNKQRAKSNEQRGKSKGQWATREKFHFTLRESGFSKQYWKVRGIEIFLGRTLTINVFVMLQTRFSKHWLIKISITCVYIKPKVKKLIQH